MRNHSPRLSRRHFVAGSLASPLVATFPEAIAQEQQPVDPATLKPGAFQWQPERSPSGPVVVLVSIPKQWVVVYRGGVRIAASSCSTGKPGHSTPSGVFIILQKDQHHHSSTYNNAPMPYMERVTWGCVALHAGNLPGYPASHGCVRLPLEFAKLLFGVTFLGTPVIIADGDLATDDIQHPGLLISNHMEDMARGAVKEVSAKTHHPVEATTDTHQASSFVISTADLKLTAFVNGKESFTAPITIQFPGKPFGTHAFTLTGPDSDPRHMKWLAVGLPTGSNIVLASALLASDTMNRINLQPDTAQRVISLMHPGSTLVVTDQPSKDEHRTEPGFTIITHDT
jgi:L,D-transpeptidase catalytic domain